MDCRATEIARGVLTGEIDEEQGRWQIAVLAEAELSVSARTTTAFLGDGSGPRHPLHDEVAFRLEKLLCTQIISTEPGASRLNLSRLASGASLTAWAFGFSRTAVRMIKSSLPSSTKERLVADVAVLGAAKLSELDSPTTEVLDRLRYEQAAEEISIVMRYARGHNRAHLRAISLRRLYGFPPVPRLVDHPKRTELLSEIEADRFAMRRAICAGAPEDLANLLSSWPEHAQERLVELPPEVSTALAASALTPMSPPGAVATRRLGMLLTSKLGDRRLASEMASVMTDALAELDCSEMHPLRTPQLRPARERSGARRRWEDMVGSLTDRQQAVIGDANIAIEELWVECYLVAGERTAPQSRRSAARQAPVAKPSEPMRVAG